MQSHDEEQALVARLRRRESEAFTELVRLYQHRVFGLLLRIMGQPDEAEELAQEVFVNVYRGLDSFRGESSLRTWIYRIATNQAKNRLKYLSRRRAGKQESLDDHPDESAFMPLGEPVPRPDRAAEGAEMERIVSAALSALDAEHREVLVLRDIEGLAYEEIAQVLGLAEGTVKSRLFRARYALKQRIAAVMEP